MSIQNLENELNQLKAEREQISSSLYRSRLHKHFDALIYQQGKRLQEAHYRKLSQKQIDALKAELVREQQDFHDNVAQQEAAVRHLDDAVAKTLQEIEVAKLRKVDSALLSAFTSETDKLETLKVELNRIISETDRARTPFEELRAKGPEASRMTASQHDQAMSRLHYPISELTKRRENQEYEVNKQSKIVDALRLQIEEQKAR